MAQQELMAWFESLDPERSGKVHRRAFERLFAIFGEAPDMGALIDSISDEAGGGDYRAFIRDVFDETIESQAQHSGIARQEVETRLRALNLERAVADEVCVDALRRGVGDDPLSGFFAMKEADVDQLVSRASLGIAALIKGCIKQAGASAEASGGQGDSTGRKFFGGFRGGCLNDFYSGLVGELRADIEMGICRLEKARAENNAAVVHQLARILCFMKGYTQNKGGEGIDDVIASSTPLIRQIVDGDAREARLLVDAKLDVETADLEGQRPLHIAALRGRTEVMQMLLGARAETEAEDRHKMRPLHRAADTGNAEAVKMLLGAKAQIEAEGRFKQRPLHRAAWSGKTEVVQMLLEARADVDAESEHKQRPLHCAAATRAAEVAQALLEAGASVEAEDEQRMTPLHLAARHGSCQVVQRLLEARAALDGKEGEGRWSTTPLSLAAANGSPEVVRILQEARARIDAGGGARSGKA